MAKNDKTVKRGVYLYIDGKEIKNDINSIDLEMKRLQRDIKEMTRGSEEYNRTMAKIKHLQGILKQHRQEIKGITTETKKATLSVGKMVDWFNRFGGVILSVIGFLTGFTLALRAIRDERNKLEESQAGLKALTGLDDESITWLTAQAKTLSTTMTKEGLRVRQSAAEILDAFMLVGSAKPELLDNKEALKAVTEEAMRLQAAAKDITLTEAVDSLTLSLNQYGAAADQAGRFANVLAAGSQAGSANIASQAKTIRNAGTAAASANVSIEQTVGLIEALAYRGIKDEVAGTGLKKFFLVLQTGADETNPKLVGLDKALENLKNKNMDAGAIKKMFGEEGFNTASVILQNTEMVKDFTKAVTDTNVAYEQAAINSDTANAKLAQARNNMKLAAIELGERLNPALIISTNTMTNVVKYLPRVIDFFEKWGGTIMKLAGFIAIYTAYTKAQIIEEKLTVFWKEKIIATSKRLYAVISKHPYAAIGLAIVALISYWRNLNQEMTESERIEKTLNTIRDTATANITDEKSQLQQYLAIARDENKSKAEREAALKRINELSPEYLGNLTLEKINTQEATDAVNKYVDSLLILEDIKQTQSKMNDLRNQRETLMKSGPENSFLEDVEAGAANMLNNFKTSLGLYTDSWANNVLNRYVNKGVEQLRTIDKELSILDKRIIDSRQKLIDLEVKDKEKESGTSGNTGNGGSDSSKDKFAQAEAAYYKRISEIKKKYLADDKMTQDEYNRQIQNAEMQLLNDKLEVAGLEPAERQRINDQILNAQIKIKDELRKIDEKAEKERQKAADKSAKERLSIRQKQLRIELEEATANHYRNLTSENEFAKEVNDIRQRYWQDLLDNYQLTEEQRTEIDKEQAKAKTDAEKEKYEKMMELHKQYASMVESIAADFGETIGEMIATGELSLKDFLKETILMALDALERVIEISCLEVMVKNLAATAPLSFIGAAKAALQIAAIKASFAMVKGIVGNFYTGGYTGPGNWDQPQGIVHSNEFVANRFAVANPNLRPIFDAIDVAQRTGNVGNLTVDDIAAVAGSRSYTRQVPFKAISTGATTTTNDPAMIAMLSECTRALRKLKERLDDPLVAETYVTGKHGVNQAQKEYKKLNNNKSRNKL